MKKIFYILLFIFLYFGGYSQNNIAGYEYWFNNDYAGRQKITIPASESHSLSDDIDVSHLPEGLNRFTIRYKDENGLYSSTYTKAFIKHTLSELRVCEYWFDNDYAGRQQIEFASGAQHQFSDEIDVSQLSAGIHVFHIRYEGDNGIYSSTQSKTFLHIPENKQLTHFEYWFNSDFENRTGRVLTPVSQFQTIEDLDVPNLNNGLNTISFRVKDNFGYYSSSQSMYFYKDSELLTETPDLVAYEYWFNNDYENRMETAFTPADGQLLLTSVDAAALPEGVNVFNIRFKDEQGTYSVIQSDIFYRKTLAPLMVNKMVAYEYWFNDDYENRIETAFTSAEGQRLTTSFDAAALPEGVNVFNIRFKDEQGVYSLAQSELFYKNSHAGLRSNKIYAYKYRIEDENGMIQGSDTLTGYTLVNLPEPVNPALINVDIDMSRITKGTYRFLFSSLDSLGLWSVTTTDTIVKTAFPVALFEPEHDPVCSNTPVRFINQSVDADTCLWNFGDGQTSNEYEPEHVFESAGEYAVFLTATDTISGRDSTISQLIEVLPSAFSEETLEICQGDTLLWNGLKYSETGDYDATLAAANGCDSTVTLHLTVNATYDVFYADDSTEQVYLVNDGFEETPLNTFPDDWVIRYEGTGYGDHYVVDNPVKNGSQSLKVSGSGWAANLSKPVNDIPDKVILEGWMQAGNVTSGGRCGLGIGNPDIGSWGAFWGRVEFYEGNLITFYYTGSSGGYGTQYVLQAALPNTWYHIKIVADASLGTYQVYINGEQAGSETGGQPITEFPLYTSITAQSVELYGNSMVYFDDIKLYEGDNGYKSICSTELPFVFGSQNLTESGQYTETFQTIHGCDSMVTINLEVKQAYDLYETLDLCQSELPYTFGTQTLTETGVYTESRPLPNGCDSTITLDFTVHPEYNIEARKAICNDSTYQFGTQLITEAGVYEEMFQSVYGCDSLVNLMVQTVPGNIGVFDTTFVSPADECFNGFYTITVAGDGYPVTVEPGVFTNYIAGQSIRFLPGFHARSGSYLNAYITIEPWYCDQSSQAIVLADPAQEPVVEKSIEISDSNVKSENLLGQSMKVYPNPNNGRFTIKLENIESETRVFMYNSVGQKVYDVTMTEQLHSVELPNVQCGIYFIKAINNQKQFDQKIVIQ